MKTRLLADCTIVTGDCVEGLGSLPAGTVDLIVADPPYNVGIDYGDGSRADRLPDAAYIKWLGEWVDASARALAPHGSMWVICGQEYAGDHQLAMRAAGLHWRNTITWVESFGVNCRRKFNRTSRPVFWFTKHRTQFTFNEAAVRVASARQTKYKDKRANPQGKILDDVWPISRVCGTFRERVKGVPTQLPLTLVRRIIEATTMPGGLVVDPFTGSGTTAVASVLTGRSYLGWELRESFAAIAIARVDSLTPPTVETIGERT
jgi:site-specific DNA-methyltransferase (adenine-specific)